MVPEFGHLALILAMCFAVSQLLVAVAGSVMGSLAIQRLTVPMARLQFLALLASFFCLIYAYVTDDFSVAYVAATSNSTLPMQYKVTALWGGHEGSMLLWILMIGGWTCAVSVWNRNLPVDILTKVLGVLGGVSIGFISFSLFTSNPFERYLPTNPIDGQDLNPLLQDFGMIVHPPMLYMGYVGTSVAFAFAVAALLSGRLDAAWARWARPWVNAAWAFLTIGIALGSWWAYYELGWGGWWFWDPVENVSFMPWLVTTALIHSIAVSEKRGVFKSWTVLLAIFAFSLSLIGAFIVRSGVITSVHAFATDPERGLYLLLLLGICIGFSLVLYAIRMPTVKSSTSYELFSRETLLLSNNIILVVATLMILIGTFFPVFAEYFGAGKISVGVPYFNMMFVPLMSIMICFMGVGVMSRWKRTEGSYIAKNLKLAAIVALVTAVIFPFAYRPSMGFVASIPVVIGTWLAVWIVGFTLQDLYNKAQGKSGLLAGLRKLSRSYYGMVSAHIGVAITVAGVCYISNYNIEENVVMKPGDTKTVGEYSVRLDSMEQVKGPNYVADRANMTVFHNDKFYMEMKPEKRFYNVQRQVMTEPDIDAGFFRDLFITLAEPLDEKSDTWALRLQVKPFARWIWLGAIFMAVGGILAITDRRYRVGLKVKANKQKPTAENSNMVTN